VCSSDLVDGPLSSLDGLTAVVGAGQGDSNFLPSTTGEHAVTFFNPIDNGIPAPAGVAAFGIFALGASRRRR